MLDESDACQKALLYVADADGLGRVFSGGGSEQLSSQEGFDVGFDLLGEYEVVVELTASGEYL